MAWLEPFVKLRAPKIFNLRTDPFERADDNSNTYWDWMIDHLWVIYKMQAVGRRADRELREVPAAPEAGVVQPRRGDAPTRGRRRRREPLTEST